ncbi:MAG TPA: cytochrome c [Bryobacteraceae bacterium]|nr:cytochrome c [Bryobacteraceae bacterium]
MASRVVTLFLIAFVLFACMAANAQPTIKKVPVTPTSAASGQEMFKTYCAACHGLDGKGTGPAAAALKKAPANLTELSAKNGGTFPELKVFNTIKGDSEVSAHGSRDMPVWGALFPSVSHSQGEVQLRMSNLTDYVKSIQGR